MKQTNIRRTAGPLTFSLAPLFADAILAARAKGTPLSFDNSPEAVAIRRKHALAKTKRARDNAAKRAKRGNLAAVALARSLGAKVA